MNAVNVPMDSRLRQPSDPDLAPGEASEASLRAGDRLRQLSRLNLGIAHDIRNPLNTILLNLELLRESLERDPESAARERRGKYVRVIREELHRMHAMVESLLEHTRNDDEPKGPCDMRALLADLQLLVQAHCRRDRIELRCTLPAGAVHVEGHPGELRWALLPLVLDAADALAGGGALDVALETRDGLALITLRTTVAGANGDPRPRDEEAVAAAGAVIRRHGGRFSRAEGPGPDPRFAIELPLSPSPTRGMTCSSQ